MEAPKMLFVLLVPGPRVDPDLLPPWLHQVYIVYIGRMDGNMREAK